MVSLVVGSVLTCFLVVSLVLCVVSLVLLLFQSVSDLFYGMGIFQGTDEASRSFSTAVEVVEVFPSAGGPTFF